MTAVVLPPPLTSRWSSKACASPAVGDLGRAQADVVPIRVCFTDREHRAAKSDYIVGGTGTGTTLAHLLIPGFGLLSRRYC
jgi:hypothetical protein